MNESPLTNDRQPYEQPRLVQIGASDADGKAVFSFTEFTPGSSYGSTAAPS